jgi:rhodanese-related sulfurtransferase
MAPLVPDIISNEFNFVIALLVGFAFGFILEQAGFSTSRKLVGLFYGYDFTVLRVFFTAGITAMFGVIALGHFGLLDLSVIYINPTYLWGAIIGGLIMGLGFVIGGFCPGTSVCAAAIGKIDAMIFIAGSIIGVLAFSEAYPVFEGTYKAEFWGFVKMPDTLHISQGLFAFLMILMAVSTFIFTTFIENKVNGHPNPELKPARMYLGLAGITFLIGLTSFSLPDRQQLILKDASNPMVTSQMDIKKMPPDELAYLLIDDDNSVQIFDMRQKEQYQALTLPKSYNVTPEYLFGKDAYKQLSLNNIKNVFVADNETDEIKAAYIAQKLGYNNIFVLKGGLNEFRDMILNFKMPEEVMTRREADTYKFRLKASKLMPVLIEKAKKQPGQETKKPKRVLGGC